MDADALHLDHPAHYRICAQGLFEAYWLDMLSGVWVIYSHQPGGKDVTILVGQVADQAALMGVLQHSTVWGFPSCWSSIWLNRKSDRAILYRVNWARGSSPFIQAINSRPKLTVTGRIRGQWQSALIY